MQSDYKRIGVVSKLETLVDGLPDEHKIDIEDEHSWEVQIVSEGNTTLKRVTKRNAATYGVRVIEASFPLGEEGTAKGLSYVALKSFIEEPVTSRPTEVSGFEGEVSSLKIPQLRRVLDHVRGMEQEMQREALLAG